MEIISRLQKLVEDNCRAVIDDDHDLAVSVIGGQENILFEIHCSQEDVGLIIGRNGRNIEAVRTVVRSACRGANVRTAVEVVNSRR